MLVRVNSSQKSSISKMGRISIWLGLGMGLGQRLTYSTASASSPLYLPIASRRSVEGMTPASPSVVALIGTRTRTAVCPSLMCGSGYAVEPTDGLEPSTCCLRNSCSTD